jgi:hypothetical protein
MNRLSTLVLLGLAGLLAGCGSSVSSSTQAASNVTYSMDVKPVRLTLDTGDYGTVSAIVEESTLNSTPKAVSPAPVVTFYSSDNNVMVSPAGVICGGQWDAKYEVCTATTTLPVNPVTITAYNAAHSVSGTTQVYVHPRAANITLSSPSYPSSDCVSQGSSVKYVATAKDSTGTVIPSCDSSPTSAGCISSQDYSWSTASATVATAGIYGGVVANAPGVTDVYAKLNGTTSTPLAFATCPPAGIVLESSAYNKGAPVAPFSTADLSLATGGTSYLTARYFNDASLANMTFSTLPLTFLSSSRLTGGFTSLDAFTELFTAKTAGETILSTYCEPTSCNPTIADFISPTGNLKTAKDLGYGYPIYSNLIGTQVSGTSGSTVLVTGAYLSDGKTLAHKMLTYDSESLLLTNTIEIANTPNSLVVAPNGALAYVGSDEGLVTVSLSTYESSILTYPITGGQSTDVITGKVLGVSPDSRYVVISDTSTTGINSGVVFLVDTTGTKAAARYAIPGIDAVTFAADMSEFWIAGTSGVYVYEGNTFVLTSQNASSNVTALTWSPDGQSYFASGNGTLVNYSTCDDALLTSSSTTLAGPVNLDATAINGIPRVLGYSGSKWLDYQVTSGVQPVTNSSTGAITEIGNVCTTAKNSLVSVTSVASVASTEPCTATQFSFSPRLEQEYITGVDSSCSTSASMVYGYDLVKQSEATLSIATTGGSPFKVGGTAFTPVNILPLSGGVLNDGRKLYIGTSDSTNGPLLHRFDVATGAEDVVTTQETVSGTTYTLTTVPTSVSLIPSFVAVVPK